MNLIVVGASYRTTPVAALERLAVPPADLAHTLERLVAQPYVREAVVLSTCNRVEVYAAVTGFHGGLGDICAVLATQAGQPPAELANHLYVHYDAAAVEHAFRVATGLDSMVVGEAQILGQLRDAYHAATEHDAAGRLLHELMQQALRVGKRAHAETGIDRAGQSVVTAALDIAAGHLPGGLAGRPALVVGAGAMGALSVATLSRLGVGPVSVTNRGADRARAPRGRVRRDRRALRRPRRGAVRRRRGRHRDRVHRRRPHPRHRRRRRAGARAGRPHRAARPARPGRAARRRARRRRPARRRGRRHRRARRRRCAARPAPTDEAAVERIVAAEVEAFVGWLRGADVAPTVAALRTRADEVVERRAAPAGPAPPRPDRRSSGPRWPTPSTGWSSGCCTRRPCGCASSPRSRAATSTRPCCGSCSTSRCRRPRRPTTCRGLGDRRMTRVCAWVPGAARSRWPSPATSPTR